MTRNCKLRLGVIGGLGPLASADFYRKITLLTPATKETGQVLIQTPISAQEEGSERRGSFSHGSDPTEEDYRNKRLARRLELPLFDGEQADSWVLRAEQFFEISEFTEEATYRILNERYNECRPLIITSNLPVDSRDREGIKRGPDLHDQLGARITSRLAQTTTVVAIGGNDRRLGAA